jgi:hypothetical protein
VPQHVDLATHIEATYGYDLYSYGRDVSIVFGIGFILRVIACGIMVAMDRERKV